MASRNDPPGSGKRPSNPRHVHGLGDVRLDGSARSGGSIRIERKPVDQSAQEQTAEERNSSVGRRASLSRQDDYTIPALIAEGIYRLGLGVYTAFLWFIRALKNLPRPHLSWHQPVGKNKPPKKEANMPAFLSRKKSKKPLKVSVDQSMEPPRRSTLYKIGYWGAISCVWMGILAGGAVFYLALGLPNTDTLWDVDGSPGVTFAATDGTVLLNRGGFAGSAIHLKDLPDFLPQAVMAIEDRRFYSHLGIDPRGLARAIYTNIKAGAFVQGGSTITQQLAKNVFLAPERTLSRKVRELLLAFWLEARFSKDQILTLYLNRVYLGAGTYGVEAASQRYFSKSARDLNVSESAMLAGLLKAPSRYAPTRDLQLSQDRASTVLASMVKAGFLSQAEGQTAFDHPATLKGFGGSGSIHYVADFISDGLESYTGNPRASLRVMTTIDTDLQKAAEKVISQALERDGKKLNVSQAALVAMTPDGAIRAMIGGRSYRQSQFNRAVQAKRQPGSAFKPIIFLTALEDGLSPDSLRVDAPISVDGWKPQNYSKTYKGVMTVRNALSKSVNTIAVQISEEVGRERVIKTARKLGITSRLRPHAALALGTFEVSLLEITAAYATFANGGFGVLPHVIEGVETSTGTRLYQRQGSGPGRVISQRALGGMNNMLMETVRTGTGRRASLGNRPSAGKTGTSQGFRDAWYIGYTADLVVGIWVGNDDGSSMNKVTGGGLPAVIWKDFMLRTQSGVQISALPGRYETPDYATGSIAGSTGGFQGSSSAAAARDTRRAWAPAPSHERRSFFDRLFDF